MRDNALPHDHLVDLLPTWKGSLSYGPATWDESAYVKSFEKFSYANSLPNIAEAHPTPWAFALWAVRREYSFLRDSAIIPMVLTEKNLESTPGFPKSEYYKTEEAYISEFGFERYVEQYLKVEAGERPEPL